MVVLDHRTPTFELPARRLVVWIEQLAQLANRHPQTRDVTKALRKLACFDCALASGGRLIARAQRKGKAYKPLLKAQPVAEPTLEFDLFAMVHDCLAKLAFPT